MLLMAMLAVVAATAQTGPDVSASPSSAAKIAQTYTSPKHDLLTAQFEDFLRLSNVAADPTGLQRNAEYLLQQLRAHGIKGVLLAAPDLAEGVPPVVYGELKVPDATRTIVFYAHYDGQPVVSSEWATPPFTPMVKEVDGEARVYARSAGDDKAAIFAQLTALSALQAANFPLKANLRFVWEGEEEAGSPHLEQILNANRSLIGGDIWLVCDGPIDQTRQQLILFGARGDANIKMTVYGPAHPLHSGHYGNWAPNPAMMLAQLLGGMKDADGHVLIPHFYDGIEPLGSLEESALAAAPSNDERLRKEFALGRSMGGDAHLLTLLNEPALEVTGMSAGRTGAQSTNSIPATAAATIDLRLVVGEHARVQQQRVVDYIRSQGYFVTTTEPTVAELTTHSKVIRLVLDEGEEPLRTPMNLPIAQEVVRAVESARGKVILLPTSGGTVPLEAMQRASGAPNLSVPIANHDDNQHAGNENLRLQNLWDGIETMAALMAMN